MLDVHVLSLHRYNPDEARQLKAQGELPDNAKINDMDIGGIDSGDEDDIEFQEDKGINIEDVRSAISAYGYTF